ncbi:MAG: serine/threonine protein kinase [Alphaproteobacteria bacterium]|nr:serine/threonine protein kinase [Alphaproteobacteria bacterium]
MRTWQRETREATALTPGAVLQQRYRLERELGRGGFSVVYKATQLNLGRPVVIKMLLPDAQGLALNRQLFEREAGFAKSLRHPHIIDIYDFGETDEGLPWIAMELLSGRPLEDVIAEGPLPPARVATIAAQALKALMASHLQGVIHQDIKPSNLFLCEYAGSRDFVKLIDFGIAQAARGEAPNLDRPEGMVLGTPLYIAPEQIRGDTARPFTDLYALGLVLAEALTGRPVYDPTQPIMDIARAHLSLKPAPVPAEVLKGPLGGLIRRATRKWPEDRYQTAEEMLQEVERCLDRLVRSSGGSGLRGFTPPARAPGASPEEGDVLAGLYRLDEKLGDRSFADVFKGTQLHLERDVAIKILQPRYASRPNRVEHFRNEVRVVSRLDSPHTIRIIDYDTTPEGLHYLVMQWLRGLQLDRILSFQGPLSVARTRAMTLQVLESLGEAHRMGLIHGNMKPSNIFFCETLSQGDFIKVTDFNLTESYAGASEAIVQTSDGLLIGSPSYMAPEKLLQGELGPWTDLYAVGLVMAEALSGQPVFPKHLEPIKIARMQVSSKPGRLPEAVQSGPLGPIIAKAIQKKAHRRYENVDELREALLATEG